MTVHYRYAQVLGHQLFYREAGPDGAQTIVLLHGFPASSFMFRDLIPRLSDRFHLIAPDYLGFGLSDAPRADTFEYTFDALAHIIGELLDQLGIEHYAIYVHDYGAPIGWRLMLTRPAAVRAIISQSGNAYEIGFVERFWAPIWAYAKQPSPQAEEEIRDGLTLDRIRWQYLSGVPDPSLVSPDTWHHDYALLSRPGNDAIQLALMRDYQTNIAVYPKLHEMLRFRQVPVLAVWGRHDEIFAPAGATAFTTDVPDAEVHLLDGGHFLLESECGAVADYMRDFLSRHWRSSAGTPV